MIKVVHVILATRFFSIFGTVWTTLILIIFGINKICTEFISLIFWKWLIQICRVVFIVFKIVGGIGPKITKIDIVEWFIMQFIGIWSSLQFIFQWAFNILNWCLARLNQFYHTTRLEIHGNRYITEGWAKINVQQRSFV